MIGLAPTFARRLLRWYDRHRRDLPWRLRPGGGASPPPALDPYHVLVSEAMLQQTQVVTVVPYFNRFIARFPTLADLAEADGQEVLRLWQGLGYYSRARNLQAAARKILTEYGGRWPRDARELRQLPGVGRYTAGAVASIAFGRRSPIVDGNVARVLCRVDRIESDPRSPPTLERLWLRAEQILPRRRVGDFNSALMELGATVCTPRGPQCLVCPVRAHCDAASAGVQDRIPAPRKAKATPLVRRVTFCIRRRDGSGGRGGNRGGDRWLIEQRPPRGRWAGMWQFVTRPAERPTDLPVRTTEPTALGVVAHGLTHRRYHFDAFLCEALDEGPAITATPDRTDVAAPRQAWVTLAGLADYPLPKPHLRVAAMLAGLERPAGGGPGRP